MDQTQRALLSTLYERWYGVLHRYAQWAVGDALLAEEIVQETFLAAVPKIEELAAGEHPERWLIQTAKYKALHVLREQARQRAKNTVLEESLAAPDQLGQWEDREYAGQLGHQAAAERLGLSLWSCQKRMQRIRKKLRAQRRKLEGGTP